MLVRVCKHCAYYFNDDGEHWCDEHQIFISQIKNCCISDLLNKHKHLPSIDYGHIEQADLFEAQT